MPRANRKAAIEELQKARDGSVVISYITSTRQGLETQMAMDVIGPVYRHLQGIKTPPKDTKIDLFIHSNGGDGIVPWRLVTLIRGFCNHFTVLVPNRAFSAATLTALGADEVLMHPMGMLGPTDPTVTNQFNPPDPRNLGQLLGISVEDVTSFIALVKDDVGINHEDELIQAFNILAEKVHPLALGNVKRSTLQSRMMGEKLLRRRGGEELPDHTIEEIVRKLGSELYYHGHPINSREAREDVGLSFVVDAPSAVEAVMWKLFLMYETDLKLDQPFMPVQEAMSISPISPALPPGSPSNPAGTPNQATVNLGPFRTAYIESATGCDVFQTELEVALMRDFQGNLTPNIILKSQAWATET